MNTRLPVRRLAGLSLLTAVFLAGCTASGPQVAEAPPPSVTVSKPVARQVTNYDEYEGRIAPVQSVEVRARVRGHLTKVNFEDGQMVEKGKLLFQVDPRQFELALKGAEAEKGAADAALALATSEHNRSRLLYSRGGGRPAARRWRSWPARKPWPPPGNSRPSSSSSTPRSTWSSPGSPPPSAAG